VQTRIRRFVDTSVSRVHLCSELHRTALPNGLQRFAGRFGVGTRAALLRAILNCVLNVGHRFEEGRLQFSVRLFEFHVFHGRTDVFAIAFAAFLFVFDVARRFGADELAFRSRAGRGFGTRPRARRLFTERRAERFRGDARRVALSRRTDGFAFRARLLFAHVFRATNRTFGLLAVNSAFGACGLLTLHFAFRASADRMADGRARRVIALPSALGVAILLCFFGFVEIRFRFRFGFDLSLRRRDGGGVDFGFRFRRANGHDSGEQSQHNESGGLHPDRSCSR